MNYVLIGLPGSGKSTVGVMLAKYIGFEFLDTDLVIQKQQGKKLSEIIEERGPEGFMAVENEILSGIRADRTVIATGGSAIYGEDAMKNLKSGGAVCIYLKMSLREMKRRLSHTFRKRGVVLRSGETVKDMYNERVALYEKYADITIDEYRLDSEQTLQQILEKIRDKSSDSGSHLK